MGITSIPQSLFAPWIRKHDKPGVPVIPAAPVIYYPRSLEDLITLCAEHPVNSRLHAAGSHWALSPAAISDHSFIETHDWNEIFAAMGRTLYEVVPGCLADEFLNNLNLISSNAKSAQEYFVHFESGKRVYQLYSELDVGDSQEPQSLCALMKQQFNNDLFGGSWAFHTLGGAGGQTVVGALSTGTHGGDFNLPPIADAVVALHLVADGGKHYWIERSGREIPFTDKKKLEALYGQPQYGGPKNFEVLYNDEAFDAALIQVGRFGVVYSAVLRVVPQYGLQQQIDPDQWENVRNKISNPTSDLFTKVFKTKSNVNVQQRFLQIAVNPIPMANGTAHFCGLTRRWTVPVGEVDPSPLPPVNWGGGNLAGRPERVGDVALPLKPDPVLNAPRFSKAGLSVPYSPDGSGTTSFSLFEFACQDANFMDGIVSGIYIEIEQFLATNAVPIGGALAAVIASGGGATLLALAPLLLAILAILAAFLNLLRSGGSTLGQALNNLRSGLLGDPATRAAGIIVWWAIANKVFEQQQSTKPYSALSYAVMDTHDYTDISCTVNVRSVEVFFDATDPNLIAFVDRLLKFEIDQEFQSGKSVAGYVSLRFCQSSEATIGPEQFPRTVAVECSGLADEQGSTEFVDYAVKLALDPNIEGVLHWGQQNDSTQQDIEFRFGDSPSSPTGPLHNWRSVLSTLTDNGRQDGFSSFFTRHTGLEIVQPVITSFSISNAPTLANPSCTVAWDCHSNPAGTTVSLEINPPGGGVTVIPGLPLDGNHTFAAPGPGTNMLKLQASLNRNGVTRTATQNLAIQSA
jgi:hypothetical protein